MAYMQNDKQRPSFWDTLKGVIRPAIKTTFSTLAPIASAGLNVLRPAARPPAVRPITPVPIAPPPVAPPVVQQGVRPPVVRRVTPLAVRPPLTLQAPPPAPSPVVPIAEAPVPPPPPLPVEAPSALDIYQKAMEGSYAGRDARDAQYQALIDAQIASLQGGTQTADTESEAALTSLIAEQAQLREKTRLETEKTGLQPIETGLIAGQQGAIARRAAGLQQGLEAQTIPLRERIANEQARRSAASDVLTKVSALRERALGQAGASAEERAGVQRDLAKMRFDAATAAGVNKPTSYPAGSVGEYQFYAEQEKAAGKDPVSFNAYQDMDANRKMQIARAGAVSAGAASAGAASAGAVSAGPAAGLKADALTSATELLRKFNAGEGTSAVGKSALLQWQRIPGTAGFDFNNQLENVISLLSLDNIKLLKGQGAVSDAERALLQKASSKLSAGQSEPEFKKTLEELIQGLSGTSNPDATAAKSKYGLNY